MKLLIVGGCFTCQHNISFDRLYHQSLKIQLMVIGITEVDIRTIRYERIGKTIEKIKEVRKEYDFDFLIFHLRTEPFMRLVKFYYKYIGNKDRLQHALNFPFISILKAEKYDLLECRRISIPDSCKIETKIHHYLRELNYIIGSIIGNKKRAIEIHKKFIFEIIELSKSYDINLLILGPVSRPFSNFENRLSLYINTTFTELTLKLHIEYLDLIGERTTNGESMFFPNGQHVSQSGHDEISKKIFEHIISNPNTL